MHENPVDRRWGMGVGQAVSPVSERSSPGPAARNDGEDSYWPDQRDQHQVGHDPAGAEDQRTTQSHYVAEPEDKRAGAETEDAPAP